MVVTRKTPLPPTPSSRSSSNQAVPRIAKVKVNQFNQPEHSSPLAGGVAKTTDSTDLTLTSKPKPKFKWRRKSNTRTKKGILRRIVGFFYKAYLVWLAVYWVCICQRSDHGSDSSICRAIFVTHDNLLEPYAFPLIKRALSYPPVEPYVKEIEPHVIRLHNALQPVVTTAISTFSTHVIPEWNNRVVPKYYTYIAPYVRSALNYLDPYLAIIENEYDRCLAPFVRVSAATAWGVQERTRPYVILAWHKFIDGYRCIKPYARPAWERFKDALLRVLAYTVAQRRRFVDPHVARMWAKIKELSGDEVVVVPTTTKPAITPEPVPAADTPVEESSTVISVEGGTQEFVSTPIPSPVPSNEGNLPPETPRVTTATRGAVNILGDGPTDPVVISVPAEAVSFQEEEPPTLEVVNSTRQEPAPVVAPLPTSPATEQATPVLPIVPEDEGDLEFFSEEIGLDFDEPEGVPEGETSPEESEEEREARLKAKAEETAWKRKEITDRHTDWEYQLEDLKNEQMAIFRLALYNVRKTASKMLKKDSTVQRAIDEFASDGERYLRGVESYLKNLIKERKQDKNELWGRVVQKVEDKFEKRLDDVDRKVGEWYNTIAADEKTLVAKATETVAEFSQKAQVDLGLDYSWLDDVTVEDWVRYHDLMRASDSFHEDILMVRNGTHPESLDNPLFRALKELRVEVEDVITGFKSRLRRIQRDGERVFDVTDHDEDRSESKPAEESPVSILPVTDEESIQKVIVGKSPEQVAEGLMEAPLEDWAASKQKRTDEVHAHEEL